MKRRHWLVIGILLTLFVTELSLGALFYLLPSRFAFFNPNGPIREVDQPRYLGMIFDADLGWKQHYSSLYGERPRKVDYGKPLMTVFGDSFTQCGEVTDDETWEEYLGAALRQDIYNFGVGGYGTDQAFLRFRKQFGQVDTPIVGIGLILENINRIVNVYRPFYNKHTGIPLTKPRFNLTEGSLELIANPIQKVEDISKLSNPEFVQTLGRKDWWYNHEKLPVLRFPYTFILFNKSFWTHLGEGVSDIDPRESVNLWELAPARKLMFKILSTFVSEVSAAGKIPLILILPAKSSDITDVWEGRDSRHKYIMSFCQENHYLCFDGIGALASETQSMDEVNSFFHGHATPKGNAKIAEKLKEFLEENNLVGPFPTALDRPTMIK